LASVGVASLGTRRAERYAGHRKRLLSDAWRHRFNTFFSRDRLWPRPAPVVVLPTMFNHSQMGSRLGSRAASAVNLDVPLICNDSGAARGCPNAFSLPRRGLPNGSTLRRSWCRSCARRKAPAVHQEAQARCALALGRLRRHHFGWRFAQPTGLRIVHRVAYFLDKPHHWLAPCFFDALVA